VRVSSSLRPEVGLCLGEDFHVVVRVRAEALAERHEVLVHHAQGSEPHVAAIVVRGEGEGVVGVEPAEIGVAALIGGSERDHDRQASGPWIS
jgi:hypothetical protein